MGERLIFVPTAVKTRMGLVRMEGLFSGHGLRNSRMSVGTGLGASLDAELWSSALRGRSSAQGLNLAYYYMVPVTDLTPGIALGVQDLLDKTNDRRSFYVAVTYRIGQVGDFNSDIPGELTVGLGTGRFRRGAFVGFMLPFADQLRILGEYDSERITAGLEVRPVRGLGLRLLFRQDETIWGLNYSMRF